MKKIIYFIFTLLLVSCGNTNKKTSKESENSIEVYQLSQEEATNLVERSYQYIAVYNTLMSFTSNPKNPFYLNGWNNMYKAKEQMTAESKGIPGPNNDTFYEVSAVDLRAEPIIITYPAFDSKYVSLETSALDHYCKVPLATSKGDFKVKTTVLYYSQRTKNYTGEAIDGIDKIVELSGDFAAAFLRVTPQVNDPEIYKKNIEAIDNLKIETLSQFQGKKSLAVEKAHFPKFGKTSKVYVTNFLEVMQFVFNHTTFDSNDKMDREVLSAFKPLGIEPGKIYDAKTVVKLDSTLIANTVKSVEKIGSETATDYVYNKFADKGEMTLDVMVSQSVTGPIGLPASEALYLQIQTNDGLPLNALNDYSLKMSKENLPPAGAFWSFTLYDGIEYLFIPNAENKYSVGENAGMQLDKDGGITIYMSEKLPEGTPKENWLPINREDLLLNLRLRVYQPDIEKMKVWEVPTLEKN